MKKKGRFEIYSGVPNRIKREGPRVTLNHRKVFLINMPAYEMLGRPAAVELGYDENTRTIALAPVDPRRLHAFPLKGKSKKYNYHTICAAPFCRHYEIAPRRTMLFTEIDLDDEGTLLLELKTAVAVGRGSR